MPETDVLKSLIQGTLPKSMRLIAARGLAPLPPGDALEALVHLCKDPDQEVSRTASQTLLHWPEEEVTAQVQNQGCSPAILRHFALESGSEAVLEAIILNPTTPGDIISNLASRVKGPLLEAILYNRVRLLDTPEILSKLKLNPRLTPEVQRVVQEIEHEFFGSKRKEYTLSAPAVEAGEPEAEKAELEAEPAPEDLTLEGLPLDPEAHESALIDRFSRMTVRQKIHHALLGTREARALLIRDPNREVARNVLRSPKLTDGEIEAFAAMRSLSEDLLREIGTHKAWIKNYGVVQNLARNPKTPPSISQRMLFRLLTKDLLILSRDRSVPEAVRRNAQRTLQQRAASKALR